MGEDSRDLLKRTDELIDDVYTSSRAPVDAMGKLIALGRRDAAARRRTIEALDGLFADGGSETGITWLLLVAGEHGRDGALAVLYGVVRWTESDIICEASVPTVKRRALDVLPELLEEIGGADEPEARGLLYEALEGALVLGGDDVRERLRTFARERWEVERRRKPPSLILEPLTLLHILGEAGGPERLRQARALCKDEDLARDLAEMETAPPGEGQLLELTRRQLGETWKDTALAIEKLFAVGAGSPSGH